MIPKHTPEEIKALAEERDVCNDAYNAALKDQLEQWVKGINKHNPLPSIIGIVDNDDNITDYLKLEDGECCPDFACCEPDTSRHWPLELRQRFYEIYTTQGPEACVPFLFMSIASLTQAMGINVHVAGATDVNQTGICH